jgi:uncharacterized protein YukE
MSRPPGDPAVLSAGARAMAAAAGALQDLRTGLRGTTSFPVTAGSWKGPASEAFQIDGAGLQTDLTRAADSLTHAAGALSELAARLRHAQSTWDQAHRLAATAGLELRPDGGVGPSGGAAPPGGGVGPLRGAVGSPSGQVGPPDGGVGSLGGGVGPPFGGVDVAAMAVAGHVVRLAVAADEEAAAARRTAAARFDHAASLVPARRPARSPALPTRPGTAPPHDPASDRPGSQTGHAGHGTRPNGPASGGQGHRGGPHRPHAGRPGHGDGAGEENVHPLRRMAGRVLEAGAEVGRATHHLVAGAEARIAAAARLAGSADDPAVRAAAARVVDSAGRPLLNGRVLHALPVVAPVLDVAGGLSEGEPLPRALAGAVGGAIGADVGGRVGLAVCGGQAAATQGAGVVICPALTAVGGAVGAHAGKETALHVYDKVTGRPDPPPAHRPGG